MRRRRNRPAPPPEPVVEQSAALRVVLIQRARELALRTEELQRTMTSQERPA